MYHRTQCQWNMLLEQVFHWEDIAANENNRDRIFRSTFKQSRPFLINMPKIGTFDLFESFKINVYIFQKPC